LQARLTGIITKYTIYDSIIPLLLGCGENRLDGLHLKMKGGSMFGSHLQRGTRGYYQLEPRG